MASDEESSGDSASMGSDSNGRSERPLDGLDDLSPEAAIEAIGKFVDASWKDADAIAMDEALNTVRLMDTEGWPPELRSRLAYIQANLHSDLFAADTTRRGAGIPWNHEHLDGQLLWFRNALALAGTVPLRPEWAIQAETNLGNVLNHIGRPVDAIQAWNRALRIDSTFPMALGNRGMGFIHYAQVVPDAGHARVLVAAGLRDLDAGLSDKDRLEPGTAEHFEEARSRAKEMLGTDDEAAILARPEYELGETAEEQAYRRWCLDERLFLNPMNDVDSWSMAGHDVLGMPTLTSKDYQPEEWIALFNQIKQEYVSARFLLYEGTTSDKPHFSDRDVLLMNPLDYPVYSLASEKIKAAYRLCYSILDRIAMLIDDYLLLKHKERTLSFKRLWHEKGDPKQPIIGSINDLENWPLRGLYWLSRDLYEKEATFRDSMLPDAMDLEEIRNALEHRMLRIHSMKFEGGPDSLLPRRRRLGRSIEFRALKEKSLLLFRLVRAAIIYAVLAINVEEQKQSSNGPPSTTMPVIQDTWDDVWKTPS